MSSLLFLKIFGGLTVTAGIGTGGYYLIQNFSKSKEKNKEGETVNPKVKVQDQPVDDSREKNTVKSESPVSDKSRGAEPGNKAAAEKGNTGAPQKPK